jgi:hypothetical protein
MTSGLETYRSDNGAIQFSSNLMSYRFSSKGSVQTQAVTFSSSPSRGLIPTTRNSDQIIAVRSQYACARGGATDRATNDNYDVYQSSGPVGTVIEYFVFDKISTGTPLNFGIETYSDVTHELTFSATLPTAICYGVITDSTTSVALDPSKNYAAVLPNFSGYDRTQYSGGVQREVNSKGQTVYYYIDYQEFGKVRGVSSNSSYNQFNLAEVSYNDKTGQYIVPSQNSPQPADYTSFDIPIGVILLIDVTRF